MDRLGLPGEDEPELVPDFGVLSRVENARFRELYDVFRQDEDLAKDELTEMQVLLDRCPLVDPRAKPAIPILRRMWRGVRDGYSSGPLRERFMITQNNIRTLRCRILPTG